MQRFKKLTDVALNVVSLLLIGYVAVKLSGVNRAPQVQSGPKAGAIVELTQADWAATDASLVIALQTHCPYCEASMDFYHGLVKSLDRSKVHVIAAFPEKLEEAAGYLESHSLDIPDIRGQAFAELKVRATPTLLLVGRDGRLRKSWVGRLSENGQKEVYQALAVTPPSADSSASPVTPEAPIPNRVGNIPRGDQKDAPQSGQTTVAATNREVSAASRRIKAKSASREPLRNITPTDLARDPSVPVIDVRERSAFQLGHIFGAVNIPVDEIEVRSRHELPQGPIVMYCDRCAPCEAQTEVEGGVTFCRIGVSLLARAGFSDVRLVRDSLDVLQAKGVPIEQGVRPRPSVRDARPR